MVVTPLGLPNVLLFQPRIFHDARGYFVETWNARAFRQAGLSADFVQDNLSHSTQGTLRGLHYQIEQPQGKLVRAPLGEVFDVAVDLRRSSPTYGRWVGTLLSGANCRQVWIPPGFAHGFVVLSETADVAYKCTEYYAPQHERTIRWDDVTLAIDWPLPKGAGAPLLSDKDARGSGFLDAPHFA